MNREDITVDKVKELLEYDDGKLIWRVSRGSTVRPGDIAGTETSYGCLQMSLLGLRVQVSHVVWFIHHGYWTKMLIDHIDRNPRNNRIENLREVTKEINVLHDIHRNSEPGVYETSAGKWAVVKKRNGLSICASSHFSYEKALKELRKGEPI